MEVLSLHQRGLPPGGDGDGDGGRDGDGDYGGDGGHFGQLYLFHRNGVWHRTCLSCGVCKKKLEVN